LDAEIHPINRTTTFRLASAVNALQAELDAMREQGSQLLGGRA
jgi:hypothetical protein